MKPKRSMLRRYSLILFLMVALMPFGCGEDEEPTAPNDKPGSNEVIIQNTAFSPSNLEVTAGTTVKWINKDGTTHTVTSGEPGSETGVFDSGNLGQNGEFSFTFTKAGTFKYFCKIHDMMRGTIVVK